MSKLTKYKFSDLYEMSSGISSSKEQAGHGSPFISFSTVFNNYFLPEELPDLMDTSLKEQEIFSVKKDDVFITRTSETVDALAMSCVAVIDYPKATFSGFVKRLRPKTTGIVYSKYIAFFLRSKYFRKVLDCNTIMTLRASFNEDMFSFLYLYLPDYEEQVRIGDLLYKMEMKIRTNNKINDNLEQQIKTIFTFQFLQNANTEWKQQSLAELSEMYQPKTISGKDLIADGNYFVYGANGIIGKYNQYNHSESEIAVACRGASCGSIQMTLPFSWITGNAMVVKPHSDFPYREYLYYYLLAKNPNYLCSGSAQPQLTRENLTLYSLKVPSTTELNAFESYAEKVRKIIIKNQQENIELSTLRDWLLPMLMNGQATVSD